MNEQDAYEAIRRLIVSGNMLAGHRLVESELADALGMSRSFVRLALARLEYEGLVEKEPGRSATVRRVPRSELLEIIEARTALEAIMARSAARRRTEAQAQFLAKTMKELSLLAAELDIEGLLEAQARFHHVVLDASRQPAFQRIVHTLAALTAQTRVRSMLLPGRVPASIKEHQTIAAAIIAGNADASEKAMTEHLQSVGRAISQLSDEALQNILPKSPILNQSKTKEFAI